MNNYHVLTYLKKALTALLVVFLHEKPKTLLQCLITIYCLFLLLTVVCRPYFNKISNIVKIVSDLLVIVTVVCLYDIQNYFERNFQDTVSQINDDMIQSYNSRGQVVVIILFIFHSLHLFQFFVNLRHLMQKLKSKLDKLKRNELRSKQKINYNFFYEFNVLYDSKARAREYPLADF